MAPGHNHEHNPPAHFMEDNVTSQGAGDLLNVALKNTNVPIETQRFPDED